MCIEMKRRWLKYFLIIGMIIALTSPMIPMVFATEGDDDFTDSFPLQTFDSRMYVVSLNISEVFVVNVTAVADGEFDLFLFSTRPKENLVTREGYDPEIFNTVTGTTLAYDNSTGPFAEITYTPSNPNYTTALYYIQVVLIDRGPDSYNLVSTHDLELYFIPFIPGYPIWVIACVSVITFGLVFLKIKRRMIKH